jgi:hypothetical protein
MDASAVLLTVQRMQVADPLLLLATMYADTMRDLEAERERSKTLARDILSLREDYNAVLRALRTRF